MSILKNTKQKLIAFIEDIPTLGVWFRAHRLWRHTDFVTQVNHDEIVGLVFDDGRMTSRYSFMVIMSCAIATLGLLLSSPAVIIGAMLISPLMGPIMLLGFSLCILDFRQMRKSLEAVIIGFILSVLISFLIVKISPLTDPTPEIMSRTRPNLFDLMVAIFSGLAGGYATIKQKGAAIVGVAIATALMPPLAVIGYGLATGTWQIAQGAFFLFMTNLLAISLSVSGLAKWYGFGAHNAPRHTIFQTAMIFIIFILLSIPLGISLKNIAQQTYLTKMTRAAIAEHFEATNSRISNFAVSFSKGGDINVDSLVVTDKYLPGATKAIAASFEKTTNRPINLSLDQIVIAKEDQEKVEIAEQAIPESALTNPIQSKLSLLTAQEEITQAITNTVFFPLKFVKVDVDQGLVFVHPKASSTVNLAIFKSVEEKIAQRFPDWSVNIVP